MDQIDIDQVVISNKPISNGFLSIITYGLFISIERDARKQMIAFFKMIDVFIDFQSMSIRSVLNVWALCCAIASRLDWIIFTFSHHFTRDLLCFFFSWNLEHIFSRVWTNSNNCPFNKTNCWNIMRFSKFRFIWLLAVQFFAFHVFHIFSTTLNVTVNDFIARISKIAWKNVNHFEQLRKLNNFEKLWKIQQSSKRSTNTKKETKILQSSSACDLACITHTHTHTV